ncbi:hypothetical protein GCM10023115_28320 [Pontixanthobacter gangjinensis]|uniref:BT4734-like N-terminal domain-containing protein n=1 Tax=Christiangramia aestuarii TaxID=1028746 RepID=A0A7K1LML7_9FLAO|nr:BT4734/BF3469 family protein [Christiangramia aestuarii]MUP42064.1 hypothetical protein [Christiangramia aestuarii]
MIDKYNTKVSMFQCCKSPVVLKEVPVIKILNEIKTGGDNLDLLQKARQQGKGSCIYDKIKTQKLNTFSPNASFSRKRKASRIKNLTGLVYLDIDGCTEIDYQNPYIFATWLSLSATGRGVLIKIKGVTEDNFSSAYTSIAREIGLDVDPNCKDITRQVVISYDPEIYINHGSKAYHYKEVEPQDELNIPLTVSKKRKKEKCDLKGDKLFDNIRWDNIEDYDLKGEDFVIFDENQYFSKAYIPETIEEGKRNSTINSTIHQLKALNPELSPTDLYRLINILNSRCSPPLPYSEIEEVKRKLSEKLEENDQFEPLPNYRRRVIFAKGINKRDRQKIGAQVSGEIKVNTTLNKIQECLDDWDLYKGRVTNNKIAKAIGRSKKTVDKYSARFKLQKKIINENLRS